MTRQFLVPRNKYVHFEDMRDTDRVGNLVESRFCPNLEARFNGTLRRKETEHSKPYQNLAVCIDVISAGQAEFRRQRNADLIQLRANDDLEPEVGNALDDILELIEINRFGYIGAASQLKHFQHIALVC